MWLFHTIHLINFYLLFRSGCTRLLSTSTPINHIVLFFFCRIPVVLENRRSGGGGAHPLHPPPRSAPGYYPLHADVKCHIYPGVKMLECSSRVLELEQVGRFWPVYNIKLLRYPLGSRSSYISFFGTDPQETEAWSTF